MDNSDEAFDALITPTLETRLTFGKHKGRSLEYMICNHPDYMLWVIENEVMELPDEIVSEIEDAVEDDNGPEY